jgi:hypothetical protein
MEMSLQQAMATTQAMHGGVFVKQKRLLREAVVGMLGMGKTLAFGLIIGFHTKMGSKFCLILVVP